MTVPPPPGDAPGSDAGSHAGSDAGSGTEFDAEFDAHSGDYDSRVNEALAVPGLTVDYFTRVKADYLLDAVAARFGSTAAVEMLDVGCGVGNGHARLAPRVARLAGTDPSRRCIEAARRRNGGVAYTVSDGRRLPYPDQSFDVAFAVCVFHHVAVADRVGLAGEMRRVLRPGGLVLLFEHNPANPLTRRVVNNCVFDRNAVLLRAAESEAVLREAGFAEAASRFILTLPSFGPATRALDRLFARLPLGAQYCTCARA